MPEHEIAAAPPPETARVITVPLTPGADADLRSAAVRERLSETDVVNRAITFYERASSAMAAGAELALERDGDRRIVKLL